LDFGDGVPVFLRSAHNIESFDGVNAGWAVLDEARYYSPQAWQVIKGRIRLPCKRPQTAVTSTPAYGVLSDEFDSGKKNRSVIIAPTRENERNLAEGFIEDLEQSYSKRALRALVEGRFTILEGAVYEDLDVGSRDSPWMVDFDPTRYPMVESRVLLAVDPGYRKSAWTWFVETGACEWIAFDELIADNASDDANIREVNARGWPIDEIWVDPAAKATQSYEAASTLTALKAIKTRRPRPIRMLRGANREISFGVDKTRVLLGGDGVHPRRIKFARRLLDIERGKERGLCKSLGAYRYPDLKNGKPISDQPLKDGMHDHFCDAARYLCVGLWLTIPALRRMDHRLRSETSPGFEAA
jgi:hypothetical protein